MKSLHLRIVALLLLVCAFPLSIASAQAPPIENLIAPDMVAAVIMHPKKMLEAEMMELFPHEVLKAMGEEQLGADFTQASEAILVFPAPGSQSPQFGVMVRFDQPQEFKGAYEDGCKKIEVDGKTYFQFGRRRSEIMLLSFPDNKTMLFGAEDFVPEMTLANAQDGPLKDLIKKYPATGVLQVYSAIEPVRDELIDNLPPRNQVPAPFQRWIDAPELVDYMYADVNLAGDFQIQAKVGAVDEKSADRLRRMYAQANQMGKAGAMAELARSIENLSPSMQLAINTYADRVLEYAENAGKPEVDGNELVFTVKPDSGSFQVATIGILTGMLLPAVQQVRFAARRTQSMNNLRQITLACLNYESAHMRFPQQAIYSDDGEPLLSWRVAILPYIEQNNLYQQFHLDEPWDSPHNIELLDQMPETYRSPNAGDLGNKTVYQGFVGKDTIFPDGAKSKVGFGSISDGSSNTILAVESNEANATEWSKPGDIAFDPDEEVTAVGDLIPGGFLMSFCDGSTHFVTKMVGQEVIKNMIQRNDGNLVNLP